MPGQGREHPSSHLSFPTSQGVVESTQDYAGCPWQAVASLKPSSVKVEPYAGSKEGKNTGDKLGVSKGNQDDAPYQDFLPTGQMKMLNTF